LLLIDYTILNVYVFNVYVFVNFAVHQTRHMIFTLSSFLIKDLLRFVNNRTCVYDVGEDCCRVVC